MKIACLIITALTVLFTGCKSASTNCNKCPYETGILEKIENIIPEVALSSHISTDTARISTNDKLTIRPLDMSELIRYSGDYVLPIYREIVDKAFDFEGVRYRRGGTSQKGIDCSGLIYACFSAVGISLPRTSIDMSKSVLDISRDQAKKGDLIFFRTNGRKQINHVGLVVEANNYEIKFIHASIKNGVIVSSTEEAYYAKSFAKVGRVLNV